MLGFNYNDGGRSKYFKGTNVGDCCTRAIAIATGKDYKEIYDRINQLAKKESVKRHRRHQRSQARNGVFKETWKKVLDELGWVHVSTCGIGCREKVKFVDGALPTKGTYIVQLSKHLTVLKDNVINDTYDCSKKEYYNFYGDLEVNDERCVYGYWRAPTQEELDMREESQRQLQEYQDFVAKEKEELAQQRKVVKKHNDSITKKYAKRINKLKAQLRKLEKERDSQLLEMPKAKKNSWALHCMEN